MKKEKAQKPKYGKINNFIYSFKKISKIDKGYAFLKIASIFLRTFNTFVFPYILKTVVEIIENREFENTEFINLFLKVGIVVLISILVSTLLNISSNILRHKNYKLSNILRREVSVVTMKMDYELLERPQSQDLCEKATRTIGTNAGVLGILDNGFNLLTALFTFITACTIISTVNPLLIIVIVVLSISKMIAENVRQKASKAEWDDKIPPISRRINYVNNISSNKGIGKDLRIYNMDKFIEKERDDAIKDYLVIFKKDERISFFYQLLIDIVWVFETILLYGFMIYEVLYNSMMIALFTFMISSVYRLTNSLSSIIHNNGRVLRCSLHVTDYRNFMELDLFNRKATDEFEAKSVKIEFQNVSYSYYMQEGFALDNVSFAINPHERVALVGYNGAGKTTIVKLIAGLYHPTKGRILINGVDIETIKRESLSKLISVVFQEAIAYAIQVDENIAMSYKDDCDEERILDILRLVELDKKIDSLPEKVKTVLTRDIDENGITLSGGEGQKLSLARAIYKSAPLFILDEPTSALDAISEYNMYNNFNKIIGSNSALYISHRLSSTKFCDRIIFLDNGKVKEMGTHEELMSSDSEYRKLFSMQAEYYKDGDDNE